MLFLIKHCTQLPVRVLLILNGSSISGIVLFYIFCFFCIFVLFLFFLVGGGACLFCSFFCLFVLASANIKFVLDLSTVFALTASKIDQLVSFK